MPSNLTELAKELRTAAANGELAQARECLTPANVNIPGLESGKTALHFAARDGHGEIVALLLQFGAQTNVQDKTGATPLLLALGKQHYAVAEQLLTAGCSVSIVNEAHLNALQLALSQPAPANLIQRLRTKLIAELTPSQHLKKNGSIQSLPPNQAQQVQSTIERQLALTRSSLLPIIFIIHTNHAYWQGFMIEQLPALRRLGYQALGLDESFALTPTDGFTSYSVGYNSQQKADPAYQKNLPSLLKTQLSEHAAKHAGGIIYALQGADSDLSSCLAKLSDMPLALMHCDVTDDLHQAFAHLTLSDQHHSTQLVKGATCEEHFWGSLTQHFSSERHATTYYPSTGQLHLKARLQRLHEAFEIVTDRQRIAHGIVPVDNVASYLALAQKVERKLQITPLLQHVNHKMSLVVPKITQAKAEEPSAYFELNPSRKQHFKKMLEQWLAYLTPAVLPHNLPADMGSRKVTLSIPVAKEIILPQGIVTKITFLELAKTQYDPTIQAVQLDPLVIFLELTLRTGKQLLCKMSNHPNAQPPYNEVFFLKTIHYLLAQGGIQDQTYCDPNNMPLEPWKKDLYKYFYPPAVTNFYTKLHQHVAQQLVSSCDNINDPIEIFSFGCGAGLELRVTKEQFIKHKLNIAGLYGFDINPNNFTIEKPDADIQFITGDVAELEKLVAKTPYQPSSYKIGLFLGILVDGCMTGNYPALQVLQQARLFDRIIISGVTHVKLNKETLKAAGFSVKMTQTNLLFELQLTPEYLLSSPTSRSIPEQKIFEIVPMSAQERKYYLTKRGTARSSKHVFDCLDLSMSAHPLRDLKLFSAFALEKVKQVDISWSYLREEEVRPFLEELAKLQRPLHLLLSPQQVKTKAFIEIAQQYTNLTLTERLDAKFPQQCPMFSPDQAKRYGMYEKLPNQTVQKVKPRC